MRLLTMQIQGKPAQCASLPCTTTPPATKPTATTLAVLWGSILCIEGTHRALAQSRNPSTLQTSFTSCSSRLYFQWELCCICRTIKLPQHKLSPMSRHARTKYCMSHVCGEWHQAKPHSAPQCIHPSSRCKVIQESGLKRKQKGWNHDWKTSNSWKQDCRSDSHVQSM